MKKIIGFKNDDFELYELSAQGFKLVLFILKKMIIVDVVGQSQTKSLQFHA